MQLHTKIKVTLLYTHDNIKRQCKNLEIPKKHKVQQTTMF